MKFSRILIFVILLLYENAKSFNFRRARAVLKRLRTKVSKIRHSYITEPLSTLSDPDKLMDLVHKIDRNLIKAWYYKPDFSAGAGSLSCPELSNTYEEVIIPFPPNPPQVKAQQLAKKAIRKLPDAFLIGFLILMSTELMQRTVASEEINIPPLVKEIANTTINELNFKLDQLSHYHWNMEPFLKSELESLQSLPFEAIDKYIVNEILPKIDKDIYPVISKFVGDPEQVSSITRQLKSLLEMFIMLLINNEVKDAKNPLDRPSFTKLLNHIDQMGSDMEKVVRDWNRVIEDVGKVLKVGSIYDIYGTFKNTTNTDSKYDPWSAVQNTFFPSSSSSSSSSSSTTTSTSGSRSVSILNPSSLAPVPISSTTPTTSSTAIKTERRVYESIKPQKRIRWNPAFISSDKNTTNVFENKTTSIMYHTSYRSADLQIIFNKMKRKITSEKTI